VVKRNIDKSNVELKNTDDTYYVVQYTTNSNWSDIFWMMYTKTLMPFYSKKISSKIEFKNQDIATEVIDAIKKAYPNEELRILKRQIIVKESFIGEDSNEN